MAATAAIRPENPATRQKESLRRRRRRSAMASASMDIVWSLEIVSCWVRTGCEGSTLLRSQIGRQDRRPIKNPHDGCASLPAPPAIKNMERASLLLAGRDRKVGTLTFFVSYDAATADHLSPAGRGRRSEERRVG